MISAAIPGLQIALTYKEPARDQYICFPNNAKRGYNDICYDRYNYHGNKGPDFTGHFLKEPHIVIAFTDPVIRFIKLSLHHFPGT
jgi:hypothetical protein